MYSDDSLQRLLTVSPIEARVVGNSARRALELLEGRGAPLVAGARRAHPRERALVPLEIEAEHVGHLVVG